MSLLEDYKKLLNEYDKVLNLSKIILAELKKEGEKNGLLALVEKKKTVAEGIARLTKEIASTEIKNYSNSNLRTLATVKGLLQQIAEKVRLLQEVENKIQNFLQKKDLGWK